MRLVSLALIGLSLGPATQSCSALDWAAFDDPQAQLLTDRFADSINDLPDEQQKVATERLLATLKAPEVEVRRRAALTLGKLGNTSGVPVMMADLATSEGHDRDNVVVALRILKDPRSIPALRKALSDESPYVRSIAVATLGELKAKAAYADIVRVTKDKPRPEAARSKGLDCFPIVPAESACYALGALGDVRAVPLLIDLLSDRDLQSQSGQALEALTKKRFGVDQRKWRAWWQSQE